MATPRIYLSTSLPPDQYERVVEAAYSVDKSVSGWVRDLILKALDARPA